MSQEKLSTSVVAVNVFVAFDINELNFHSDVTLS